MHDDFWREVEEDIFEKTDGEFEACPVMSVLENLKCVAIEVNLSIKVHVVKGFHRNLVLAAVFQPVGLFLEGKIMLDRASWILGLLILARGEAGEDCPECKENWDGCNETEENSSLETTANLPRKV